MERVDIHSEEDIVRARQCARDLSLSLGFSLVDKTRIATATSELARNIFKYAREGRMEAEEIRDEQGRRGLRLAFIDTGPGIPDIEQAMDEGFSSADGLGQGLPGSKRLMDEFHIESAVGEGTRVEVIKWLK
ncbi:MAG: anti-sigma regulatory factor [Gemmatimonadetes bacterium]|jgi:serine/threonine-protein kinase RsbT|nr:anti-sigma regulatory factor [Gemmatimonadota bacterium]